MSLLPLMLAALAGLGAEEHPILRLMPGSTLVGGAGVEEGGEMVLSFRGEDGRVRERVRGKHWSLELDVAPEVTRDAIIDFFESQAQELPGGVVLRRADNRLTFRFRGTDGGDSWCDLWATDGNYALEIVDELPEASPLEPEANATEPDASATEPETIAVEGPVALEVVAVIRFVPGDARLGPGAGALLDDVVARAVGSPGLRFLLRSYRSTSESHELAESRATVVADALALYGIAPDRVDVSARVSDEPGRVDVLAVPD